MRTFSTWRCLRARLSFVIIQKKKTPQGCFSFWPTRKDSNLRPSESESDALSSCATGRYLFKIQVAYATPSEFAARGSICVNYALCADCTPHLLAWQYTAGGMRSLTRYPAFLLKHSRISSWSKPHSLCSLFLRIRNDKNNHQLFLSAHHG